MFSALFIACTVLSLYFSLISADFSNPKIVKSLKSSSFQNLQKQIRIDPCCQSNPVPVPREGCIFSHHFLDNRIFTADHPTTGATQICHVPCSIHFFSGVTPTRQIPFHHHTSSVCGGKEFLYSYVHTYLMSKSMSTVQYSNLQNETCWYLSYNHSYSINLCIYILYIYIHK